MKLSFLASLQTKTDDDGPTLTPMQRLQAAKEAARKQKEAEEEAKRKEAEAQALMSQAEKIANFQEATIINSKIIHLVTLSFDTERSKAAIELLLNTDFFIGNKRKKPLYEGIPRAVLNSVVLKWKEEKISQDKIDKTCKFLEPYIEGIYEPVYKLLLRENDVDQAITLSTQDNARLTEALRTEESCYSFINSALTTLAQTKASIKKELQETEIFCYEVAARKYFSTRAKLINCNLPHDSFEEIPEITVGEHYRNPYDYQLPKCATQLAKALDHLIDADKEESLLSTAGILACNPLFWKKENGMFYVQNNVLISRNIYGRGDAPASKAIYGCTTSILARCWDIEKSTPLTLGVIEDHLPSFLDRMFGENKSQAEKATICSAFHSLCIAQFTKQLSHSSTEMELYIKSKKTEIDTLATKIKGLESQPTSKGNKLQILRFVDSKKSLEEQNVSYTQEKEKIDNTLSLIERKDQETIRGLSIRTDGNREQAFYDVSQSLLRVIHSLEIDAFSQEILTETINKTLYFDKQTAEIQKQLLNAKLEVEQFLKEVRQKSIEAHEEKLSLRGETYKLSSEKQAVFESYRERILEIPQLHSEEFKDQLVAINRCIDVSLGNVVTIPSEDKKEIQHLSRQLSSSEIARRKAVEEKITTENTLNMLQKQMDSMTPSEEGQEALELCQTMLTLITNLVVKNKEYKQAAITLKSRLNSPDFLEAQLNKLRPQEGFAAKIRRQKSENDLSPVKNTNQSI